MQMDRELTGPGEGLVSRDSPPRGALEIRHPTVADAAGIWRLVQRCAVLDKNSCYAYLLICRDFADTSLVAESGGELVGFVSAYRPPARPEVVFVWQVGTAATARRLGLAKRLLGGLLDAPACRQVRFLEATVTPSNTASAQLFRSVAEERKTEFQILSGFPRAVFDNAGDGGEQHESEDLVRIGPLGVQK